MINEVSLSFGIMFRNAFLLTNGYDFRFNGCRIVVVFFCLADEAFHFM